MTALSILSQTFSMNVCMYNIWGDIGQGHQKSIMMTRLEGSFQLRGYFTD